MLLHLLLRHLADGKKLFSGSNNCPCGFGALSKLPLNFPPLFSFYILSTRSFPTMPAGSHTGSIKPKTSLGYSRSQVRSLTSPLFNVATLGVAILWLLFVGEPRQTLRHPILRIVGWAFVGLYASIVIMTATAGYVVANFGPRHLEDWQKKLFGRTAGSSRRNRSPSRCCL